MLDSQQEKSVRADFASIQNGPWFEWFAEVIAAKRDAALQKLENSADWESALRYKTELKTAREIIDLMNKFAR